MIQKQPKPKKCRNPECGQKFTPRTDSVGQHVCSYACGLAIKDVNQDRARKALHKVERQAHKAAKERIKSKGDHAKDAQTAFNAWIRLRDHGQPCISCGTTADIQYAAGHFRTVGSCPELRFEPLNVHLQCNRNCNMAKSGNIMDYRIELVKRIGQDKVDWLEGPHEPKRYTIEDLQAITKHYRALVREMKKAGEGA